MRFKIELDSDNDGFKTVPDLLQILEKQVTKLRKLDMIRELKKVDGGKILDINGNTIGSWELEK